MVASCNNNTSPAIRGRCPESCSLIPNGLFLNLFRKNPPKNATRKRYLRTWYYLLQVWPLHAPPPYSHSFIGGSRSNTSSNLGCFQRRGGLSPSRVSFRFFSFRLGSVRFGSVSSAILSEEKVAHASRHSKDWTDATAVVRNLIDFGDSTGSRWNNARRAATSEICRVRSILLKDEFHALCPSRQIERMVYRTPRSNA